jgi:hypothetical protein
MKTMLGLPALAGGDCAQAAWLSIDANAIAVSTIFFMAVLFPGVPA